MGWRRGPRAAVAAMATSLGTAASALLLAVLAPSVSAAPTTAGAPTAPTARLYVTSTAADTVSVLDTATTRVLATIAVGRIPWAVVVSPDGGTAYVSNRGEPSVSVIDTRREVVTRTIGLASESRGIAIAPDGSHVYIAEYDANRVLVLDVASGATTSIATGVNPYALTVSPDGRRVYVADVDEAANSASTLTVIDTATNRSVGQVSGFDGAEGVAVSADSRTAYVTSIITSLVQVVDTRGLTVTGSVAGFDGPQGITADPQTGQLFVADSGGATLSVIRPPAAALRTIQVGRAPAEVAVSADGRTAYSANFTAGTVSVIDTSSDRVTATVTVGGSPHGIAAAAAPSQPQVSSIASSLATPAEAFGSVVKVTVGVGLAASGVLLLTFPAHLFNLTFEENYDDFRDRWRRLTVRLRRRKTGEPGEPAEPSVTPTTRRLSFAVVVAVGGLFGALLDPAFGANLKSLDSYLAIVTATLIAVFVPAGMSVLYHRRQRRPLPHHLHALPGGLLIAAACVLISRVADFQPGYLYGVVATVAFTGKLARDQKGRVAALTSVTALTLALLAWFAWVPLSTRGARVDASHGLVLADDLLASMVVGGLVGCVITLLPLRFLPGWTIRAWSRRVWLALFGLASFAVIDGLVLAHPPGVHHSKTPLLVTMALFVVFGASSIGLREITVVRRRPAEAVVAGWRARLRELATPLPKTEPETSLTSG